MTFASILGGEYVVWHNTPAQITVRMENPIATITKIQLVVGINTRNFNPNIKLWTRSSESAPFIYTAQLSANVLPTVPSDGSFVDAVYETDINGLVISEFRLVVTANGAEAQEFTPIKKYNIFVGGNTPIVGGSVYAVNDLGWQVGEVFATILSYLEEPISSSNTINIETETSGLLPEARIRNDDLLARVADNELITGVWDFENGQLRIERGDVLPINPDTGRLFQLDTDSSLYIGSGSAWVRLLKAEEFEDKICFSYVLTRASYVLPGNFLKIGSSVTSANDGIVLPNGGRLGQVSVSVSSIAIDNQAVEVLRDGVVVAEVFVQNGTKYGNVISLNIPFTPMSNIAVRASEGNVSSMDAPKVALFFKV